jgi:hypothetical protein
MASNKRDNRSGGSNRERSGSGGYTRMIADRPATVAAIASGVAAAVVGFLAFKRSGKSFSELSEGAGTWIKDGLSDVRSRTGSWSEPRKDGIDDERSQSEIAEEALTTKQTGKKSKRPVDPTIEQELKTGAISY